jgi:uncharacterized protein
VPSVQLPKRAVSLLIYILIGYGLVLLLVRVFESRLVFFPNYPDRLGGHWRPRGLPVEDIWLTSSEGIKLHAWWIPKEKARWTFLAFHGNAGNIADRTSIYEFLRDTPANVFALEYRGYGHSEGRPSERGLYRDADAALEYLRNAKNKDPKTILAFGQSLGTAVAAYLAARNELGGLILEAPFPSASRVARKIYWFLPGVSYLVRGQFNTREKLKSVRAPVLIIQCTQDPVMPPELGQEVYEAAHPPKDLLRINGYCHEEASLIAPAQYRAALNKLLSNLEK